MALCMQARSMRSIRSSPKPFKAAPVGRVVCRASPNVEAIVEQLKTLTLLEASQLVTAIETTFGVDASAASAAPVMMMAASAVAAPVIEEKTTFDLVLNEIPADKKVSIYKVIRTIAGIAVNQVKDFTATLPKVVQEGVTKAEAEEAMKQMTDAGAKCSIN